MLKLSQSKTPYKPEPVLCVCVHTQYVHMLYTGVCMYTVTVLVRGQKHEHSSEINGESGILKCRF